MTAVYAKYMLIIEKIIAFLVILLFIKKKRPALNDFRFVFFYFPIANIDYVPTNCQISKKPY